MTFFDEVIVYVHVVLCDEIGDVAAVAVVAVGVDGDGGFVF